MKKKILRVISTVITAAFVFSFSAYAEDGDPNIGGGGGGMGSGENDNGWAITNFAGSGYTYDADGLRVYAVNSDNGQPVTQAVDVTNFSIATNNVFCSNSKRVKYNYKYNGENVDFTKEYHKINVTAAAPLPRIIANDLSSADSHIDAVKAWLQDFVCRDWLLSQIGLSYDDMRANAYNLAVEPIAYFRYGGANYALTATETALFDEMVGGDVFNKLNPLTHKNLPLAIFLERNEFLGSETPMFAWTGDKHARVQDDGVIVDHLGIGYVDFRGGDGGGGGDPETGTAQFRYPTDTWVVTSFNLANVYPYYGADKCYWYSDSDITWYTVEEEEYSVKFNVGGDIQYMDNVVIPSGKQQRVWVKWKTPQTPQTLTLTATSGKTDYKSCGYFPNPKSTSSYDKYVKSIIASVEIYDKNDESTPPDPVYEDRLEDFGYNQSTSDSNGEKLVSSVKNSESSWTVWDCQRVSHKHKNSDGTYDTYYTWDYWTDDYSASLEWKFDLKIVPSRYCKTAYDGFWRGRQATFMKSAYGVEITAVPYLYVTKNDSGTPIYTSAILDSVPLTAAVTNAQIVTAYFPEFNYKTYNRVLDVQNTNEFVFKVNKYSPRENNRVHYTPLRYPDDTAYRVAAVADYCYTPAGALKIAAMSNTIVIDGSVYDDYYVAPVFD